MQDTRHVPSGAMGTGYDQDVMTPRTHWSAVLRVLGRERFDVDLFTDARTRHNVPSVRDIVWPQQDARVEPWVGVSEVRGMPYCAWGNPPFGELAWVLERAASIDWRALDAELTLLVPLRPHRVYWDHAHTSDLEVHLRAFAFEGQTNTFPLPCCLLHWGARAEQLDFAELGAVVRTAPLTQYAPVDTLPSMAKNDDPLVQRAGVTNLDTAHLLMCRLSNSEDRWQLRQAAREGKQLPHRLDSSPFSIARDFPGFGEALAELAPLFPKFVGWGARYDERKRLAERILAIAARGMPEAMAVVQLFAGIGDPDPDNWRTKKKDEPATAGFERWTNCRELAELIREVRKAKPKPKPKPKTKKTTKKSSSSKSSSKKTTKRASAKKPPQRALPSPASKPSAAKRTKHDEGDAPAKSANDAGPLAASASDALTTFLAGKSVGDEFQVGDVLKLTSASRSSVVRACATNVKVQQEGKGRGAKWKVVA